MSYLHDRRWWMRPFERWGRCQEKNIFEQFYNGIRFFDFRIRFNKDGNAMFCHGLLEYESAYSIGELLRWLDSQNTQVYVRLLYESVKDITEDDEKKFSLFTEYMLIGGFRNIKFVTGYKTPWTMFNRFNINFIEIAKHFDRKIDFLLAPKYWANRNNGPKLAMLKVNNYEGIVSIDFV